MPKTRDALTAKMRRFCLEYQVSGNATKAAAAAGYSKRTARQAGAELMANPVVLAEVRRLQDDRAARLEVEADDVFRRLWLIATADPNDLIEHRRVCCRFCHGIGNHYQRTDREMGRDRLLHERAVAEFKPKRGAKPPGPFDEMGGGGYDERRPPDPACQECFGDGVGKVVIKDTRHLSPAARCLYAGIRVTKGGDIEVRMHDQRASLVDAGRHLGMFVDRHELTGKNGGPIDIRRLPGLKDEDLDRLEDIFARAVTGQSGGGAGGGPGGEGPAV